MSNFNDIYISPWLLIPLIFCLWVGLLLIAKRMLFAAIKSITRRTKTKFDDIFLRAASLPITLLIFASGGVLVERILFLTFNIQATVYLWISLKAVGILAAIVFADRFLNGLIHFYRDSIEVLQTAGYFIHILTRVCVFGLGLLVLLDTFGISITPILASLGIGSLAVALALQPTLENLFSGVQIVTDRPFREGHFIKLDSGEEGFVENIGWRSTWIRLPQNNMIVLPNKMLVNAKLVNYHYPTTETVITVGLGVHYNSDLEKVENVLIEIGRDVLKTVVGGVKDFQPVVRFHTFNNSSIDCNVVLRVREFADSGTIKHEFIKRVHKRFAKEGITIPYPVQAVNYTQEGIPDALLEHKNIRDVLK